MSECKDDRYSEGIEREGEEKEGGIVLPPGQPWECCCVGHVACMFCSKAGPKKGWKGFNIVSYRSPLASIKFEFLFQRSKMSVDFHFFRVLVTDLTHPPAVNCKLS